jgi:hypothetical protein
MVVDASAALVPLTNAPMPKRRPIR